MVESDPSEGVRGRLSLTSEQKVDEKVKALGRSASSLWRVAVAIGFFLMVLTLAMAAIYSSVNRAASEVQQNRLANQRTRSALCLSVLVDSDRSFEMPAFCLAPEIAQFYPPEVCVEIEHPEGCGSRFRD